jgi:hypothetical protein
MFNTISWQGYWIALAFLSAAYYLAIYLLYFRNGFKISLPSKKGPRISESRIASQSGPAQSIDIGLTSHPEFQRPEQGTDEHVVYALIDEVAAYFNEVKKGRVIKEELLFAVRQIVAKYPVIKDRAYKESINSVIISEADHHCSVQITSEEMGHVWLGS